MLSDVRIAFRWLRKNPGLFFVASLTLAFGAGANDAVFSLFQALMLRSLPVEEPGALALLGPGSLGTFGRSDRPRTDVFSFA